MTFQSACQREFRFLREKGFRMVASGDCCVHFESDTTVLKVLYDQNHSYEISLLFNLKDEENSYSGEQIHRYLDSMDTDYSFMCPPQNTESLKRLIKRLAGWVANNGGDWVDGNREAFKDLEMFERSYAVGYQERTNKNLKRRKG